MRVGLSISSASFESDPQVGAQSIIERARVANQAKLDLLSLGDHHLTPMNYFQNVPMLGRLLAEWQAGPVGCLFLLPLWNPVLVAEQVGTLAALTKSTFVIQTGVGDGEAIFKTMGCDAITVSPYLGRDAIEPFIKNLNKGVFILAVTSNPSARELQEHGGTSNPLYKKVIQLAIELNQGDNIGLVVGATQIEVMEDIRKQSKGMPWLIPGVGSQDGDLGTALNISHENGIGIINVSRGILYAGKGSMKAVIQAARDYSDKIRGIVCDPVNC